eukprot:gene40289-49089_t
MPQDLEQGGTWLVFDQLSSSDNCPKFAIVLNYHDWRDDIHALERNLSLSMTRGSLVTDFVNGDLTAAEYATSIYARRDQYRPFNLVLSDESGTFYVSCSRVQSQGPEKLVSGKMYGVSNGFMWDAWEKVTCGIECLSKALSDINFDDVKHEMRQSGETLEKHDVVLAGAHTTHLPSLLTALLACMKDCTPLSDPSFLRTSDALSRLASIYVLPTLILKGGSGQLVKSIEELLPYYLLPEDLSQGGRLDHTNLFGTRTVTILVHGGKLWTGADRGAFVVLESEVGGKTGEALVIGEDGRVQGESIQIITNVAMNL